MKENKLLAVLPERHKSRYPMLLQLFAEGEGEGTGEGGAAGQEGAGDKGEGGAKTFSQEEVNKLISERLGKEKNKWEKDFQSKLEEQKSEAEKLAAMNAEQKADHERQKRDKALSDREAEITRRELRATALETLAEKGLPKGLADILNYADADATQSSIDAVEKSFREAVEAAVNEKLKGNPPRTGSNAASKAGEFGKKLAESQFKGGDDLESQRKSFFQ